MNLKTKNLVFVFLHIISWLIFIGLSIAVSYTHLDVYKRQVQGRKSYRFHFLISPGDPKTTHQHFYVAKETYFIIVAANLRIALYPQLQLIHFSKKSIAHLQVDLLVFTHLQLMVLQAVGFISKGLLMINFIMEGLPEHRDLNRGILLCSRTTYCDEE